MKYNLTAIISVFMLVQLFVSCNNDITDTVQKNAGFLEYQYKYQLNGVEKTAYKRVYISDAFFKLHDVNDLDSSLIKLGFRKVEVYLTSQEFKIDSLKNPLSQAIGTSFAHITLVDSLGNDANPNRILPYAYNTTTLAGFKTSANKKSSCVIFDNYLNRDTLNNSPIYTYNYTGQASKTIIISNIGKNRFQIIANGLSNSLNYNLYYFGTIRKEMNLDTN